MIYDRVGVENNDIRDIKNIKVTAPDKKYAGDDDIEVFDNWLISLLRWLRVCGVNGPQKDQLRVDLCGTCLTGMAADWFAEEVESFNREIEEWRFDDLVCAMWKRFIHDVSAQSAAEKYAATRYDPKKGALALFNEMKRNANRMVQKPDDYSFKRKFLLELPQEIIRDLFKSRKVSAEHTPIDRLLAEVKSMENSLHAIEKHSSARRTERTTNRASDNVASPSRPRIV